MRPPVPDPSRTPPPDRADVVVVGARCAGAATALLLARAGLRVVVLDRASAGADTLSTHALLRTAVVQLHRWGLLDAVRAAGTPPISRTVFRYGADETIVTLKAIGGVDVVYAPRRTVLDPVLQRAATAAGADVRFGHTVTALRRDGDGGVVGVSGRTAAGDPFSIEAPLTIAADGASSPVAAWVDAPVQRTARAASAFVYAHVPGLAGAAYEFFYGAGVTAGIIPTNGGESCVYVGTPPDRFRRELAADVRAGWRHVLLEVAPDLRARVDAAAAAAGDAHGFRSYPGRRGFFRRPYGPGWALVGDAGYFKDPITAHGMSDALRDAELLARAVVDAGPDGTGLQASLAGYHRRRDRLSMHLFATTEQIAGYGWDTTTIGPLLKALAASTSDEVNELLALPEFPVPAPLPVS